MTDIACDRYALIIGSMKCATTSLFSYLAEHPEIAPAMTKEPEFFSKHRRYRLDITRYEDLFRFDPARHRYAMEASTGYTKWSERGTAEAVYAYGLRPRLIYVVRDPFERIESHYNSQQWRTSRPADITNPNLVQTSNYYVFASDYSRVFGRDQLLILDYASLVKDPAATVDQVCRFLDVPPVAVLADASARNVTGRPQSGLERQLRRLAPALGRVAPEVMKEQVRRTFGALRPDKTRLTLAQRRRIADALAPDMARFGTEYGIDVAKWGF